MRSDYQIHELVHRGSRSRILRATRGAGGERVIVKESVAGAQPAVARARSLHEFSIAEPIHSEHVAHYLSLEHDRHHVALVEEAFGDGSLAACLEGGALSVGAALTVGIRIGLGVEEIHAHHVIHRAIHPGNVLVDRQTWTAKIADFAAASLLTAEADPTARLDERAIPLSYISPEQTGRMNRKVDYRTNLYSLGATLYHALAGQPPFQLTDPLALVHAHLALVPRPLHELDVRIPEQVSRIVDKLLAKGAEDRYQSAHGVVADLEECLLQLRSSTGQVEEFALGRFDASEKLSIPEKLYGRETERAELLDAFTAAAHGHKLLLTVSGYSGIGKSSLVHEVHKPIVERRGTFISGKFDQLHRHVPYSALGQALAQLCRGLFGLPEAELATWKTRILEALSINAGLMLEIAPDLERIVGPQPPVPATGLIEAQHRFTLTLARFLSAFAGEQSPLVLFLDDLQWADPATLQALAMLLRLPEPSHLLVIGAYRDNEVGPAHPLALALAELRDSGVALRSLQLTGLSEDEVRALVADALHQSPEEVRPLARLVMEKTSGNPFFVAEFLRTLHEEKLLRFSSERHTWMWDLPKIEALDITDNVAELMVRKLERLPAATQHALELGACLGNRFNLSVLAAAADLGAREMRACLAPAVRERLIVPLDPYYPLGLVELNGAELTSMDYRYRFLHDRVQQAAYEGIPSDRRPALHLRLGRVLRAAPRPGQTWIFDVVDQLNHATALITDPGERFDAAELNLTAGRRARLTTAYDQALNYLNCGMALLPSEVGSEHCAVWSALHLLAVESAYLAGRFEQAEAWSDALLPKLHDVTEKAELYATGIVLETNRGHNARAIELAREALALLGDPIPSMKSVLPLAMVRAKVELAMAGKKVEELAELPDVQDPRIIATLKILSKVVAPAFFTNPKLLFWASYEILRLSIKHGIRAETAVGAMHVGMVLVVNDRDYDRAREYGELALRLARRKDAFPVVSSLTMVFAAFIHGYARHHARTCIALLERAVEVGLQSGDLLYLCYASGAISDIQFFVSEPIDRVLRWSVLLERVIQPFLNRDMTLSLQVKQQAMHCLRGETQGRTSFSTESLAESTLAAATEHEAASRATYLGFKIALLVWFGQTRQAVPMILAWDQTIEASVPGIITLAQYDLFACLALIEGLREPASDPRAMERLLRKKLRVMRGRVRTAPVNFLHQHLLLRAELAESRGQATQASDLYHRAIQEAVANGYHHYAALALELAARASRRRGNLPLAQAYLEAARAGYLRWGAYGKVRALEEDHSGLTPRTASSAPAALPLDLVGVVRASQALSSETSPTALLDHMLSVIVHTSGARRATFLVEEEGVLRVEGHLDARADLPELAPEPECLDMASTVSEAIVRYTLRSGEDVVLASARERGAFTQDPYVMHHASKSILCMPVRHQSRVAGALFLENELASDTFTAARLELLRLLVAQAAISLENARLFDSTQKLNVQLRSSEALLRDFFEGMPVGVYVVDSEGRAAFANRRAGEITGKPFDPSAELEQLPAMYQLYVAGTEQLYPVAGGPLARALQGESSMVDDVELRLPERTVPLAAWTSPIRGDDGAVRYAMVAFQDISSQRESEAARTMLEAQLHQAERLESIGRLAGGVAHDFNNLLTPMLIYAELALNALPAESPVHKQVKQIHDAAEHAATLTKQLLAFGRRQALEPRIVDLNQELREFEKMIRRLVRENIELTLQLEPNLGRVRADSSGMQRVFMNLALNAADAMPEGGHLAFETKNASAEEVLAARSREQGDATLGPYVMLRVSDTGHGMDEQTLTKVFDPFFTTKPVGHGTGLGLPTVYGVITQHGGQLAVHSKPGHGTSFEIFLPQVFEEPPAIESAGAGVPRIVGHGETILVVEDQPNVRAVVEDVLKGQGYRVITAENPDEALRVAHELGDELDLLITDIVMPGMNGRALFAEITRIRPNLRALFISGYSEDQSEADGGPELLPKPFSAETLGDKVQGLFAAGERAEAPP